MRLIGLMFKHLLRDPANVNAMKQSCVIIILAFLPYSYQIHTENAAKTFKFPFLSVTSHINCIAAHCLIKVYLRACAFIRS